jgi:hypothetical protein
MCSTMLSMYRTAAAPGRFLDVLEGIVSRICICNQLCMWLQHEVCTADAPASVFWVLTHHPPHHYRPSPPPSPSGLSLLRVCPRCQAQLTCSAVQLGCGAVRPGPLHQGQRPKGGHSSAAHSLTKVRAVAAAAPAQPTSPQQLGPRAAGEDWDLQWEGGGLWPAALLRCHVQSFKPGCCTCCMGRYTHKCLLRSAPATSLVLTAVHTACVGVQS